MIKRNIILTSAVCTMLLISACSAKPADTLQQQTEETFMESSETNIKDLSSLQQIYLAGGCFWGTEAYMKKLPGVYSTDVGYANGNTENPSYEDICYKNTGHAETVHVTYDTSIIPLETLLKGYFQTINPTSLNKQGNDKGSQYRSGIYYTDIETLPIIQAAILEEQKNYKDNIVTETLPLHNYYLAEEYHQDYLDKNPDGYCHVNLGQADQFITEEGLGEKLEP